jgi:hypothetical protein
LAAVAGAVLVALEATEELETPEQPEIQEEMEDQALPLVLLDQHTLVVVLVLPMIPALVGLMEQAALEEAVTVVLLEPLTPEVGVEDQIIQQPLQVGVVLVL